MRIALGMLLFIFVFAESSEPITISHHTIEKVIWPYKAFTYMVKALSSRTISHRLLLYGSCLDDQMMYIKELAQVCDCPLIYVNSASIVDTYYANGFEVTKKIFEDALLMTQKTDKPVIIVLEHIDLLNHRIKALQTLSYYLDIYKNDPRICIVCTAHSYEKLDPAFVSHFSERQRLKIGPLDSTMRKRILDRLLQDYTLEIEPATIEKLVSYSKGMNVCDLENVIAEIRMLKEYENQLSDTQILAKMKLYRKRGAHDLYTLADAMGVVGAGYLIYIA